MSSQFTGLKVGKSLPAAAGRNSPLMNAPHVSGSNFSVVGALSASFMRSSFPRHSLVAQDTGLVDERAQCLEFFPRRGGNRFHFLRGFHLESGIGADVIDGHAGEYHRESRFERVRVEVEDALRRHDPLGTSAVELVLATDLLA